MKDLNIINFEDILNEFPDNKEEKITSPQKKDIKIIDKLPENLYRDYRVKTYLNARHFIYIDGRQGTTHPHTWEFSLYLRFPNDKFIEFTIFEKTLKSFLEKYQNVVVNTVYPFNYIIPTLENIADYFTEEISNIIENMGGVLLQMIASETPTRSYIVNPETSISFKSRIDNFEKKYKSIIVSKQLDSIINK